MLYLPLSTLQARKASLSLLPMGIVVQEIKILKGEWGRKRDPFLQKETNTPNKGQHIPLKRKKRQKKGLFLK
jgi:hypothetical protein